MNSKKERKNKCSLTEKERKRFYYLQNKEHIKEKNHIYRSRNRDKDKDYYRRKREFNTRRKQSVSNEIKELWKEEKRLQALCQKAVVGKKRAILKEKYNEVVSLFSNHLKASNL